MRRFMPLLIWVIIAAPAWSGELRVGAAAVVITPPAGIPMAGYYSERGAQGVHDDLHAKAIVIEAGGRAAALVVLDLITTPRELVEQTRREIERTTHLRGGDVMISATHTHTGPVLDRNSAFGGKSEAGARLPRRPAGEDRRGRAPGGGSAHARAGLRRVRPRGLDRVQPPIPHEGRHGRLEPRQAQSRHHQAGRDDRPRGPGRRTSSRPTAKPLATYVNYAVHLDNVGEPKISADLPFTLARALADFKGPEMITLFSAGCCGDVNHIDVRWREPQRGFAERRAHGHDPRGRGAAVLAAVEARRGRRRSGPQRDRPARAARDQRGRCGEVPRGPRAAR